MPLDVTLYHLPLNKQGFDLELEAYSDVLDQDEQTRLQRFRNPQARNTFLQARFMLKTLLAEKLHCPAKDILFRYSESGKPTLAREDKNNPWHFSLSHSKQHIVVALARENIGVDVEDVKRCEALVPKTAEFLNQHAESLISGITDRTDAAQVFTEYWCCLESFVKLRGSAIWQEKERVQPVQHQTMLDQRQYVFEDVFFSCLIHDPEFRIALASYDAMPNIHYHFWTPN